MNENQRTAQWYAARTGKLTASRAYAAVARSKRDGKKLKAYTDLLAEIIAERVTGIPVQHFVSEAMQWGIDHEDEAIECYETETGNVVKQVGFVFHPGIENLGASPDGFVGEDGLIEVKCPSTLNHLERLQTREIPEQYKVQMQVQLICTARRWCDFVDYDPRLSDEWAGGRLLILRYEPKPEELQETLKLCEEFLAEVDKKLSALANVVKAAA